MGDGRKDLNVKNFNRSAPMLDIAFIAATLAFFALGALFVHACERI